MSSGSAVTDLRVGIDLGTTNSLVAVVESNGTAAVLESRARERLTPSVVGLPPKSDGSNPADILVGREAVNNERRNPTDTIRSIKRFMGLSAEDARVKAAAENVLYKVTRDPGGNSNVVVRLGARLLLPEEVSAFVLRQLKEDASAQLGKPVIRAVITVPAYFLDHQREATRAAGLRAGLQVLALLDEPTAAALAESALGDSAERARVLVFDFGGGTLDISLIQRSAGSFTVLGYGGDNFLGGDDIDRRLRFRILDWISARGGVVKDDDHILRAVLNATAEQAKRTLAAGTPRVAIEIPSRVKMEDGSYFEESVREELFLTQDDFAEVLAPIEERIRSIIGQFLERETIRPDQIDEVLMVGGSSSIDRIQLLLRGLFEQDGKRRVRLARGPMEAVAKGAAIYASMLEGLRCPCGQENDLAAKTCVSCGRDLEHAIIDSTDEGTEFTAPIPRTMGVAYRRGEDSDLFQPILERGLLYPTDESHYEPFQVPSVDGFQILIYVGEESVASHNDLIGVLKVNQIPADVQRGDPVHVYFSYTRDRTLFISLEFPTSKSNARPRWRLDPPDGTEQSPDDPIQILTSLQSQARVFLSEYGQFMDPGTRRAFEEHLRRSNDAILQHNREEATRLSTAIHASMLDGCGVASTLFLAEKTIASDDAELGPAIREGAVRIRKAYADGLPDVETMRQGLQHAAIRSLGKARGERGGRTGEKLDMSTAIVARGLTGGTK